MSTGVKFGDVGTGPTTRSYHTRRPGDKTDCGTFCRYCWIILCAIGLVTLVVVEIIVYLKMQTISNVVTNTFQLPASHHGIQTLLSDSSTFHEQLVFLPGVPVQPSELLVDTSFETNFPNAARVERVTEYCQWQEFSHTSERVVGHDDEGNEIVEKETSYTYLKDWRPYRINSLFFNSPVAYHNPQRDPFPAYTNHATALIGDGSVSVEKGLLQVTPKVRVPIPHDLPLSPYAVSNGVTGHDGRWIYSENDPGTALRIVQAAASYFIDGVVDIGLKGKCAAGDVRVGFQVSEFPESMSMVGQYDATAQNLNSFSLAGGMSSFLSIAGEVTLKELVADYANYWVGLSWAVRFSVIGVSAIAVLLVVLGVGKRPKEKAQ